MTTDDHEQHDQARLADEVLRLLSIIDLLTPDELDRLISHASGPAGSAPPDAEDDPDPPRHRIDII